MTKVFSSITDEKELKSVIESKVIFHKNSELLKGSDLLHRFHKALFSAYKTKDDAKRKKIKSIVDECIKKMENL
jgi:hypothetical protein